MQRFGWAIFFLSNELLSNHQNVLISKKIQFLIVPKKELGLKRSILSKLRTGFHDLGKAKFDWLIVDDYDIGPDFAKEAYLYCRKIMRIEDLHTAKWDCDLVLDMNYRSLQYTADHLIDYPIEKILIGPDFALLDIRYALLRSKISTDFVNGSKNVNIFLNFGSLDINSLTLRMLRILIADSQMFNISVVVQTNNVDLKEIQELVAIHPNRCKLFVSPDFLGEIMANCSISIGAGGISIWERLSLGLIAIVASTARNQDVPMEQLANDGYIFFAGQAGKVLDEELSAELSKALELLKSKKSSNIELLELVDGKGVQRVYERMMKEV